MKYSHSSKVTHEYYFRKHHLSVEQFGEMLVKVAFKGEKMPDNHKGYDIGVDKFEGSPARIEVKSKFAKTRTGKATVVHCNDNKFNSEWGMTHLVVVLIADEEQPSIEEAWILNKSQAKKFRTKKTKSKYIPVSRLRQACKDGHIKSIKDKLQRAAESVV